MYVQYQFRRSGLQRDVVDRCTVQPLGHVFVGPSNSFVFLVQTDLSHCSEYLDPELVVLRVELETAVEGGAAEDRQVFEMVGQPAEINRTRVNNHELVASRRRLVATHSAQKILERISVSMIYLFCFLS